MLRTLLYSFAVTCQSTLLLEDVGLLIFNKQDGLFLLWSYSVLFMDIT
jgi:hypothetical protein